MNKTETEQYNESKESYMELVERLESLIAELTGDPEADAEVMEAIDKYLDKKEDKIDAYAYVLEKYEAEAVATKAVLDYYTETYRKQYERLIAVTERIEARLVVMHKMGAMADKNYGKRYQINFRNYPKVDVKVEPEKLPEEYQRVTVEVTADKKKLAVALKNDPEAVGLMAELVDNYKVSAKPR